MPTVELVVFLLLLIANGVFAMSEIAVVASRKIRLEQRASEGDRRAAAALRLKEDSNNFLSTVQVGITLVGILAGAYSGARLAGQLAVWLAPMPFVGPYANGLALALVVGAITYLSLVIGELVPKAIALNNPERVASIVAAPVAVLARLATPVVRLLTASTRLVLAVFRIKDRDDQAITEGEIRALIKQASESGDVAQVEHEIVEQVFRLGDRRVTSIMTPRHDIDWIDVRAGVGGLKREMAGTRHPRMIVCDGEIDVVLGVAHAEELLELLLEGKPIDLRAELKPALFVPETLSVFELVDRFRGSSTHLALVLDEFGAIEGLVTATDILEGLVGEIPSELSTAAGPIVQRADGSWLVDGSLSIHDLAGTVDIPAIPDQEAGTYETLAGLVMKRLSRVPREGDAFTWGALRFEVMDMDGRRVDKVLICDVPAAPPDGGERPDTPPDRT